MKPGEGASLLRDWPAGEVVRVACTRCDRAGRYRLAGMLDRFDPAAGGPDVLAALSADCPRRGINRYGDPCGVYYPDLLALARAGKI
jgi:hypothetical protein